MGRIDKLDELGDRMLGIKAYPSGKSRSSRIRIQNVRSIMGPSIPSGRCRAGTCSVAPRIGQGRSNPPAAASISALSINLRPERAQTPEKDRAASIDGLIP
jgi:hypothetical protein